ncbi:hypothetical protein GH714_040156 [Hevea brasiliensis]|uniref:Cytochrome b561 domain-containing protein n=1 Tax=Hevea brasiliensis TaxID=3981 RepID=A0A6A6MUM0_HEVBR|nr:hypothetical protein GH714_040156 [Hevea brasiliensis]
MALEVKALPFTFVAHALAIAGAILVLVWCIHFRGGLAWEASNKNLIFNVRVLHIVVVFCSVISDDSTVFTTLPNKLIWVIGEAHILGELGLAKYGSEALLVNFTAVVAILYGAFVMLTVIGQGPPAEDDYSYTAI